MNQVLSDIINTIKNDRRINTYDKAATKQCIILRLLTALSWDTFNIDEVKPEHSIDGHTVDYALRIDGQDEVFIEVKNIGADLENHQEHLLNCAFKEGVKLSILTNGVSWWFYLPLNDGSWEQRKFYTIDLMQQSTKDIAEKFIDFLSKNNVINGTSLKNAENIYHGRQKFNILKKTIPTAWNKLIEQKDELLIELINDFTEKLCGFKADYEMIETFLNDNKNQLRILSNVVAAKEISKPSKFYKETNVSEAESVSPDHDYTGKNPIAFYFKNKKIEVRSWKDVLIKFSTYLRAINPGDFNNSLKLSGRQRPYFSLNPNELRVPLRLNGTNIFVETNLSANRIMKICIDLAAIMGYGESDLKVEIK